MSVLTLDRLRLHPAPGLQTISSRLTVLHSRSTFPVRFIRAAMSIVSSEACWRRRCNVRTVNHSARWDESARAFGTQRLDSPSGGSAAVLNCRRSRLRLRSTAMPSGQSDDRCRRRNTKIADRLNRYAPHSKCVLVVSCEIIADIMVKGERTPVASNRAVPAL